MDLIYTIIQSYLAINDVTKVYGTAADWVIYWINNWSKKESTAKIEEQLARLVTMTETEIRLRESQALKKLPRSIITPEQREQLIGILINMTRNIRTQMSVGTLPSNGSFLRNERLLDQLLQNVEPVRHANELVTPNSPWQLKQHLGMGSFGEVWLASNPDFPAPRAYKFFTREGSADWLRREQQSLVGVFNKIGHHPQIVDFEDVQATNCEHPYLAFEYMAGGSLEEWILKHPEERVRLDPTEIVTQITRGLAAAHEQEIQHRDIKPANILLTGGADPQVKIGDFGLAKVAATPAVRVELSQLASLGATVGTQLYLPPEAQQRSFKRKATQDDVFAVGVVWFQLIIGAIERPSYDFAARLTERGTDSHTIRLIERCLAHPDRRFRDAQELLDALGENEIPPVVSCPAGWPDVQHLAREFLAATLVNKV